MLDHYPRFKHQASPLTYIAASHLFRFSVGILIDGAFQYNFIDAVFGVGDGRVGLAQRCRTIVICRECTPMHSPVTEGRPARAAASPIVIPRGTGRTRIARPPRFHHFLIRAMSIAVGLSLGWGAAS